MSDDREDLAALVEELGLNPRGVWVPVGDPALDDDDDLALDEDDDGDGRWVPWDAPASALFPDDNPASGPDAGETVLDLLSSMAEAHFTDLDVFLATWTPEPS